MRRKTRRWGFFLLATLVGLAVGIAFGWLILPVQYTSTGLHTLRVDYKTDFVLMVAELYHHQGDAAMALARLRYLRETSPLDIVQEAIAYAEAHRYAPGDLQMMRNLSSAIQDLPLEWD